SYRPQGVCARGLSFEIEDNIVKNIEFMGGCSGNTQGVAALAEGMDANELIERLAGIRCGFKSTSCPDQLAKAVAKALEE
ncbi:MAG: TIGR03905 family TSCPD domain-containing protein, partial [Clostridia bacterium]|nr:TIGR03905 family TSCPD domain-containing protein [Clostridia bacterium]